MILKSLIKKIMNGNDLDPNDCHAVLEVLLDPDVNALQVASFLTLLHAKGETVTEISTFVSDLRAKMLSVDIDYPVLDIVGTGGDGFHTVNISTGSALLAASCGVRVAKHGNRSVSSLTGSADVLEALGMNIHLNSQGVAHCIKTLGIGFCYSPHFHHITQTLRQLRKQLNIPTTFNILGPLLNPVKAQHLLFGVAEKKRMTLMADVLMQLNHKKSVIVHGCGLDEISGVGPADIIEINQGIKKDYTLDPLDFGIDRCRVDDLRGGDATTNAALLLEAFNGKKGPIADALILNAGMALYLYGIHLDIHDAIYHARETLYQGTVTSLLNKWVKLSNEYT